MATEELTSRPTNHSIMFDGLLTPKGYEQVTGLSTAQSLSVPANSRVALLQAQDQDIRWRDDGTAPTSTVGMVLAAGDSLWYTSDLSALQFIQVTPTATLNVSYYGGNA